MERIIKNIMILFLRLYKVTISNYLSIILGGGCKYKKTCSEFAIDAVSQKGVIEGTRVSFKRFLSCQPFSNKYYAELNDIK